MRALILGAALAGSGWLSTVASAQVLGSVSPPAAVFTPRPPDRQEPTPPAPPDGPARPGDSPLTPSGPPIDLYRAGPDTYAPQYDRQSPRTHHRPRFGHGYATGVYVPWMPYVAPAPPAETRATQTADEAKGYLRLQVEPSSALVFVDGYFIGSVDDARRVGLALSGGPHRVEVRESGYTTLTFDVRIVPGETITYRRTLERVKATDAVAAAAPPAARTFYVIPGCYAGDQPPRGSRLPAGCDVAKVRTIVPVRPVND